MRRNRFIGVVIIIVILLISLVIFFIVSQPGSPDRIVIGGPALEQNTLIYVADEKGFFAQNGLNVTIRDDYPNGVGSVHDMAAGTLDMSVSAEYPVIARIFSGGDVSIVATIDKYQNEKLISRKDSGILSIADLKGKKVGIPRGTILEFFLGRFLTLNNLSYGDVTLVDVNASHAPDAIASGEVDAIAYFQPYVSRIEQRLGDNAVSWPMQSSQLLYGVIAARTDWIAGHPSQVERILRSLEDARIYSLAHPDETREIVKKRMNLTDAYITAVWTDHQFSLSLDQSLIVAMNDEARWMIINNLTAEKTVPDFRNYIDTSALGTISPDSVNIR